ncbi:6-phosphogluconolactonase [bacterium]|nr:6-phosphogluconolactonase [bacterium]
MEPKIQICKDISGIVQAARHIFKRCYEEAVDEGRDFTVALSGGKTPEPFYRSLADPGLNIDWPEIHVFMTDERFVPFEHMASNWGMICRNLLDRIELPDTNRHPVRILADAAVSAEAYEREIRQFFQTDPGARPVFDLMIMGLGQDGHTASLFPGTPALAETSRFAVPVIPANAPHERITVTFPLIHNAGRLIFLVTGSDKAERVRHVLIDRDERYPATLACQGHGEVYFFLDEASATNLSFRMSS